MPDDRTKPARLERNLGWIVLLVLLIGCLLVLRPFASALLWAVVLCFSSWPLYQRLLKLVRGRRTLAALLMALGMILIILLPFLVVGLTGIELGDHQRFTAPFLFAASVLMTIASVALGVFPL